ncbi:MAG: SAM-dependent methyltransferase, partial [Gammaproteobacteria bacterium]|nr:SAM-dependent methyltransferase [Gammaproteobacteria bacterium]
ATDASTSKLSSPAQYLQGLSNAGFQVIKQNSRRDFALEFFKKIKSKTETDAALPTPGLNILMQQSSALKTKNLVENITNGLIAPVEIIAQKI